MLSLIDEETRWHIHTPLERQFYCSNVVFFHDHTVFQCPFVECTITNLFCKKGPKKKTIVIQICFCSLKHFKRRKHIRMIWRKHIRMIDAKARNSDLRVISRRVCRLCMCHDAMKGNHSGTRWWMTVSWTITIKMPCSTPSSLETRTWLCSFWILLKSPWEIVVKFCVSRVKSVVKMVIYSRPRSTVFSWDKTNLIKYMLYVCV